MDSIHYLIYYKVLLRTWYYYILGLSKSNIWVNPLVLQWPRTNNYACANTSNTSSHINQEQLLGCYHDTIHLDMKYITILMQVIVYSMGAYKALSIVPSNCLCITQISISLIAQSYSSTLPPWMIPSYCRWVCCAHCAAATAEGRRRVAN